MLSVNFKVDSVLEEAFKSLREEYALIRAIVITVENEVLKLRFAPFEASVNIDEDLSKLRNSMKSDHLDAAFVIVKVEEGEFSLVSYCAECIKPKVKILYSSSAHHLSDASGLRYVSKELVECIDEIVPSLFAKETNESRENLMTEQEKMCAAMDRLELAPKPTAMPGVTMPLTEEGMEILERFGRGEVCAITFTVMPDKIAVDKTIDTSPSDLTVADALKALIPADHPRFAVLRVPKDSGGAAALMLYICPSACKPRDKMSYSSTKSSFLAQAKHHGVIFVRRLELDNADEIPAAVAEALRTCDEVEHDEQEKPVPPKPTMSKGPRMLI